MGVKEYELPNGRKAVFEFDENGVGKITLEAMDMLMGLIKADLVRCGECEYADEYNHCKYSAWWNGNADFCSHGIRRKESQMIEMERAVNQILWYECMGDVDEYFENDTYIVKPYDWSEYDNNDWHFYHKPSGLKIQWYKYPLRSAMWNMELTHEQFLDVLYDCRSSRYKNVTWDHNKWWERRADEGVNE